MMNIGRKNRTDLPRQTAETRLPLSVYLAYLLVATVVMTGVTFSGYITTVSGSDEVRVAVMATEATITVSENIPVCPGESTTIPVVITNRDRDGRICEVAQEYLLSISQVEDNLPLVWKVYSDAQCTQVVDSLEGELPASTETAIRYWVRVTWPAEKNSASYALNVDALKIVVTAEQMD